MLGAQLLSTRNKHKRPSLWLYMCFPQKLGARDAIIAQWYARFPEPWTLSGQTVLIPLTVSFWDSLRSAAALEWGSRTLEAKLHCSNRHASYRQLNQTFHLSLMRRGLLIGPLPEQQANRNFMIPVRAPLFSIY